MSRAVFPPCYLLGPNYGGGNEYNGDLPQKIPCMYCYSPCPQPCSRPPLTHAFTEDSQTPTGKSPVGSQVSDHELLIAKFRLKLTKVGKTTRPFRYDLNQMPNNYTLEVRNRFKGLNLIEFLMNYERRFMTLYRWQGSGPPQRKRNAKKQNGCLRRPYK